MCGANFLPRDRLSTLHSLKGALPRANTRDPLIFSVNRLVRLSTFDEGGSDSRWLPTLFFSRTRSHAMELGSYAVGNKGVFLSVIISTIRKIQ